jgi:hypothetical protein
VDKQEPSFEDVIGAIICELLRMRLANLVVAERL